LTDVLVRPPLSLKRIQELDTLISSQVNEILHAPDFQKLEASWRGLHFLVSNTECSEHLKLRLLNVTKKELLDDLKKLLNSIKALCLKRFMKKNTEPLVDTLTPA
jgi:type VI secretion system protein ImpC